MSLCQHGYEPAPPGKKPPPCGCTKSDVLLLVAVKTDQPNIRRRLLTILAAAEPTHDPPDTEAAAYAKSVDELTHVDRDALAWFFGNDAVQRLNIPAPQETTA